MPDNSERLLGAAGVSAISAGVLVYAQLPQELRVLGLPEWLEIPTALPPELSALIVGLMGIITIICGIEISKKIAQKYFSNDNSDETKNIHQNIWRNTTPFLMDPSSDTKEKISSGVLCLSAMLQLAILLSVNIQYSTGDFSRKEIASINAVSAFTAMIIFLFNENFNNSSKR